MSTAADAAATGSKTYTLKDLQENGTSQKLLMLLHDKVYDVTKFLDEHPGGDEVLLGEAGRDATEAFEDVGHSDDARSLLGPMYLGEFTGEKKAKKAGRPVGAIDTASKSGSSITWLVPVALVGAYFAWRFYLA